MTTPPPLSKTGPERPELLKGIGIREPIWNTSGNATHICAFVQGEPCSGGWQCSPQITADMWNCQRTAYETVTVLQLQGHCMSAEEIPCHCCSTWKWFSSQPAVPRPILFSHIDGAHEAAAATDGFSGTQQRFSALQQQKDCKSFE